ncbi:MAG: integrase arm-type DNA-binding domain-containing protein, partial [Rhodobacteraceae bacterium]|nr:integrase arm-type DNA-binding domain-containing protein [Paracoccaceae bacterium]
IDSNRRNLGLGGYPDVSLGAARQRAREAREMIWQGIDPVEHRKSEVTAVKAAQMSALRVGCCTAHQGRKRADSCRWTAIEPMTASGQGCVKTPPVVD